EVRDVLRDLLRVVLLAVLEREVARDDPALDFAEAIHRLLDRGDERRAVGLRVEDLGERIPELEHGAHLLPRLVEVGRALLARGEVVDRERPGEALPRALKLLAHEAGEVLDRALALLRLDRDVAPEHVRELVLVALRELLRLRRGEVLAIAHCARPE